VDRLLAWYRVGSSVGALVALIVANAIPLIGVLFLGWNVWTILIVYWLENGIVGGFNVLKMAYAGGEPESPAVRASTIRIKGRPAEDASKAFMIPFFVMHYGIFWLVHGVFVLTLPLFGSFSGDQELAVDIQPGTILLAVIALAISHGLSFWWNFLVRGEYRHTSAAAQMFRPYGRLVILHVTIIFGALAISFTGAPAAAIAILVVLKTALDVGLHLSEHRTATPPPVVANVDAPPA
jgi:hypothetical protein